MDAQHLAEGLSLEKNELPESKSALTPPTSEDLDKIYGSSSELSELSEPEEEEDDFEIEPDHYWGDGKVPVFKPVRALYKMRYSPHRLLLGPACKSLFKMYESVLTETVNSLRLWNNFGVSPSLSIRLTSME